MSMLRTILVACVGALAVQSAAAQDHGRGAVPAPAHVGPVMEAADWRDAQAVRPGRGTDGGLRPIQPPGRGGLARGHDDDIGAIPAAAVAAVPAPPAMPLLAAAFAALGVLRLRRRRGRRRRG